MTQAIEDIEDDALVRFLAGAMEEMESWTCTDREFVDAVGRLGQSLADRAGQGDDPKPLVKDDEDLDDLIRVAAYLKATPSIRLLHLAGRIQPGIGGDIVTRSAGHVASEEKPIEMRSVSRVVLDRITVLARAECYSRVFGPDRRADVLDLLEEIHGTDAGGEED